MMSSLLKATILLILGFAFIMTGILVTGFANRAVIIPQFFHNSLKPGKPPQGLVSYPYLALSMAPLFFGVLLVGAGIYVLVVSPAKGHYRGD